MKCNSPAVSTETFDPNRRILSMEGASAVYRDEIADAFGRLNHLPPAEAENLVATAGEDERAYALRKRSAFLDVVCRRVDEFLLDDEGGFYKMVVHFTAYDRSDAALEIWFHVATQGGETGGIWFRHMVVGIDDDHVYADIGPPVA